MLLKTSLLVSDCIWGANGLSALGDGLCWRKGGEAKCFKNDPLQPLNCSLGRKFLPKTFAVSDSGAGKLSHKCHLLSLFFLCEPGDRGNFPGSLPTQRGPVLGMSPVQRRGA